MAATDARAWLKGSGALAASALLAACGSPTAFLRTHPPTTSAPAIVAPTGTPTSTPRSWPIPMSPATPTPPIAHSPPPTISPLPTSSPLPQPIEVTGCPFPAAAPITAAPGVGKTVALTFDDGSSTFTPQILAVLSRFHLRATFFDTGLHDTDFPQDVRQVIAAGDVLGNHTFHHLENWGFHAYFTQTQQRLELTSTNAALRPLIGHDSCVMRPPGGAYDARSLALVRSLGMSLVLWTTDAKDWRQPPVLSTAYQQTIVHNVEAGIDRAHPIILLHAGKASHEPDCGPTVCAPGEASSFRGNTVAALPTIIRFYLAHGYRFVTL